MPSIIFDMDDFFSNIPVDLWKKIIGEELHYHYGYFTGQEDLETGLRRTVRNFYDYIPSGSRLLDAGCGWGGPARMLINEQCCEVQGITVSTSQVEYCKKTGLNVQRLNLEHDPISGDYDIAFMLETLSHIRDKGNVLQKLREQAARLLLSVNCVSDTHQGERVAFGGHIFFCSPSELKKMLEKSGWNIQSFRDRRSHSLPTLVHWQKNLEREYGETHPPGQLGILRKLTGYALKSPLTWCDKYPLIDVVAE